MNNFKKGRPKLSDEERRDYLFQVRLNEKEFQYLEKKIKDSKWGCRRRYLMELSRGNTERPQVTEVALFDGLRDIYVELNNLGKNVNQIAKKVNSFANYVPESVIDYELRKCIELLEECKKQASILQEIGKKISEKL